MWVEAVIAAMDLENRIFNSSGNQKDMIPYKVFAEKTQAFSTLYMFGSKAFVFILKEKSKEKLTDWAVTGTLDGYHSHGFYQLHISNDTSHKICANK